MKKISFDAAHALLDLAARMGSPERAKEQLEGAVALHNALCEHRVAYLADEVGMGKTYVALATLALFRHFNPSFRVLVIAPRENIQKKWVKELRNFVAYNVRFADLRIKGLDGEPAREAIACDSLTDWLREVTLDPDRDMFLRLSSFSMALGRRGEDDQQKWRQEIHKCIPYLPKEALGLPNKTDKKLFKDLVAKAINCAAPEYDLVIIDEAHNLKHGFNEHVAARNRVLGLVLGHPQGNLDEQTKKLFSNYGPKARRVLFLSATPVEDKYEQLRNQLDVVGKSAAFPELKREAAKKFLIRRVTTIKAGTEEWTKNLYRREWRHGGVDAHDEPIRFDNDIEQRLVVALVQKKVSELLGHERFGAAFQIGMLASFESFLQTAQVKGSGETEESGNFDDAEQTDDAEEREGIDVGEVNKLAESYRKHFNRELPHPKMDALVKRLSSAWTEGRKALVFVRRVHSVTDLKRKLDEAYDAWIYKRLERDLPEALRTTLEKAWKEYQEERAAKRRGTQELLEATRQGNAEQLDGGDSAEMKAVVQQREATADHGGLDTFFAWFFRGEGPQKYLSGARLQQRFGESNSAYSTFFAMNHVAWLLGTQPGNVRAELALRLKKQEEEINREVNARARHYLSANTPGRAEFFDAAQGAALELLKDSESDLAARAKFVWHQLYEPFWTEADGRNVGDISRWLETKTFFTEIVRRPDLCEILWPEPKTKFEDAFREKELRGRMIASASRLGHAFLDMYVMLIGRIGSMKSGAQEGDHADAEEARILAWLDLLDAQRRTPRSTREWGAFDELAEIATNHELILDVNLPNARTFKLIDATRRIGTLLGKQQPVGGMIGGVNQTLVRQFRMPGYPLVLITTEVLQEGEDLHTFCSDVHHYGIAWTPSAMEQRTGRIDRVRSLTDRRMAIAKEKLNPEEKLQVYYPHLQDTVEVFQVQKVLGRMNEFLKLMHEDILIPESMEKRVQIGPELAKRSAYPKPIEEPLKTAFPVTEEMLQGPRSTRDIAHDVEIVALKRLQSLRTIKVPGMSFEWEAGGFDGYVVGTAHFDERRQPFYLGLRSLGKRIVLRCISPIGRVGMEQRDGRKVEDAAGLTQRESIRLGAISNAKRRSYNLTVEEDVLLGDEAYDCDRASQLVARVVKAADQLERGLLPGKDQKLSVFRKDLIREASSE